MHVIHKDLVQRIEETPKGSPNLLPKSLNLHQKHLKSHQTADIKPVVSVFSRLSNNESAIKVRTSDLRAAGMDLTSDRKSTVSSIDSLATQEKK